jgi:hypothetical protein
MNTLYINVGEELLEFSSFQQWVNKAQSWFRNLNMERHQYICVDKSGRICVCGAQFMRAGKEHTFPVTVYAIEDAPQSNREEKQASAQQAQPKITPHCGVCFWFPSETCDKCTEYSHFVEDPA